jgi:hypothetical protein
MLTCRTAQVVSRIMVAVVGWAQCRARVKVTGARWVIVRAAALMSLDGDLAGAGNHRLRPPLSPVLTQGMCPVLTQGILPGLALGPHPPFS